MKMSYLVYLRIIHHDTEETYEKRWSPYNRCRCIRDDGCPGLRLLERDGEFAICVQVSAPNRAMAEQYCDKWAARLRAKFGDDVFAEGETSLAQATLDALLEKRKLLVAVDEPTGRLLGSLLQPLPLQKTAAALLYGHGEKSHAANRLCAAPHGAAAFFLFRYKRY